MHTKATQDSPLMQFQLCECQTDLTKCLGDINLKEGLPGQAMLRTLTGPVFQQA